VSPCFRGQAEVGFNSFVPLAHPGDAARFASPPVALTDGRWADGHVVDAIQLRHMKVVIPPKSNRKDQRKFSRKLYRTRHFVENFFCKIKRYRRVATRYEKTSANFLGFVLFAAVRVWLA
jgi:putative transposase